MSHLQKVVLVQGSQPSSVFRRSFPPLFQSADGRQAVYNAHEIIGEQTVAGQKFDLITYCQMKNPEEHFPRVVRIAADHLLTVIWMMMFWEKLAPTLQNSKHSITHTGLLGHSMGVWIAAFAGGLCDYPTWLKITAARAIHCAPIEGNTIVIRSKQRDKNPPNQNTDDIGLSYLAALCEELRRSGEQVWVSVINDPRRQVLISGTPSGIAKVSNSLEGLQNPNRDIAEINLGPPWHTQLLAPARAEIAKAFPPASSLYHLSVPLLVLNKRGRLRQIRKPEEVIAAMLHELTEPFNYFRMASQLPPVELHEVSVVGRPFLQKLTRQINPELNLQRQPQASTIPQQAPA